MHTLKVQLGLTLTVLLSLSMLLFGLVVLMLWQRNGIRQETDATEQLLTMLAASITVQQNEIHLPAGIKNYLEEQYIQCIQITGEETPDTRVFGDCSKQTELGPLLQQASHGSKKTNYTGMTWNGFFFSRSSLLMALPVQQTENKITAIGLIRSLETLSNPIKNIQKIFFAYLAINLLIFVTIGFTRLVHLVIRPIQRLSQLAETRTDHNDTAFFTEERWGEFTQLSSSLNRLVSRIDGDKQQLQTTVHSLKQANDELQNNRDEMIRTEKLASIGRLSAGLAHEIGNPLGIVQGYVDLLADESLSAEDRQIFSKKSTQELERINNLVRGLLDLSRTPSTSSVKVVNIHELLTDTIDAVHIRKTSIEINYKTDFTATASMVTIDNDGLRQVFLNCILNSIDAIEEQGECENGQISIKTANENGSTISISIEDNGAGLDEKYLDSIFDPFFTTKEVGKGTGLGLAVVHNMIKNSGGKLHFASIPGGGSTLTLILPTTRVKQENE